MQMIRSQNYKVVEKKVYTQKELITMKHLHPLQR
jgi:hypothetical protein